ncbi:tyrosine-protein kinase SPK-1-like [Saccostrea cucullata]|uniref:tyrosine-protein kinase SPK-1-like n=1 Tax=Saccostrea cuccullata TaxID=36930 RepID=UPI002ED5E433
MKEIFGQLVDCVPHGESGESLVVQCAYDFDEKDEQVHNNLYFKEKDRILLHQSKFWNSEKRWLMAVHLQHGNVGYIPRDYLASEYFDDVPELQEWWLQIGKQKGTDLLCVDGLADGTFMIVDQTGKGYTLLVRFGQPTLSESEYVDFEDVPNVKEYPITISDKTVSIVDGQFFPNLSACMAFHIKYQGSLCCPLTKPYPQERPTHLFSGPEIDKALIVSLRPIHRSKTSVLDTYSGQTRTEENITAFILKKPKGLQWGIDANDFIEGAEILKSLSHKRVLSILGVSTMSLPVVMIAESAQWNLKSCLITHRQCKWKLEKLIDFATQIAEGMIYLGEEGLAHGDLRAENVMVKCDFSIKIAGFFYSRDIRNPMNETNKRKVRTTMK